MWSGLCACVLADELVVYKLLAGRVYGRARLLQRTTLRSIGQSSGTHLLDFRDR